MVRNGYSSRTLLLPTRPRRLRSGCGGRSGLYQRRGLALGESRPQPPWTINCGLFWRTQTRPVTLFEEPIQWVDTTRYLGVTLDTRLNLSPHIDQVTKKTSQRMGTLGPLLNRKSDLSVRNGVLLYKQLIRPMMDYPCPAWRSAARTYVQRLQVLQSKCLRLATVPPGTYVTGRHTRIWVFRCLPTTSEH